MISKSGTHAVNALSALARSAENAYLGTAELAEHIGAPRNYLGKLLKTLAEHGLVDSQKGKGGGFRLARPPENISLYDVMEPIDHVSRWTGCLLGQPSCSGTCPAHNRWSGVRQAYLNFLHETTLAHLNVPGVPEPSKSSPS
ncbi:MAG: Rrf2 family transcriptional regulator [Thermoguttaceae bacterium]|jgi:Rrf2 family protein|nr:Rrf2 family transcriptional regulator [Thermoguttaceae bacterium]